MTQKSNFQEFTETAVIKFNVLCSMKEGNDFNSSNMGKIQTKYQRTVEQSCVRRKVSVQVKTNCGELMSLTDRREIFPSFFIHSSYSKSCTSYQNELNLVLNDFCIPEFISNIFKDILAATLLAFYAVFQYLTKYTELRKEYFHFIIQFNFSAVLFIFNICFTLQKRH